VIHFRETTCGVFITSEAKKDEHGDIYYKNLYKNFELIEGWWDFIYKII
jgi:predicted secreted protein